MEASLGKHCLAVCKQAFVLQFERFKLFLKNRVFQGKKYLYFPQKEDTLGLKKNNKGAIKM